MTGDDVYLLPDRRRHGLHPRPRGPDGHHRRRRQLLLRLGAHRRRQARHRRPHRDQRPGRLLLPRDGDGPDHQAGPGQHRHGEHGHARGARASIPPIKGVYLPRVATSILQTVSNTQPTTIDRPARRGPGPDAPAAAGADPHRRSRTAWSGRTARRWPPARSASAPSRRSS